MTRLAAAEQAQTEVGKLREWAGVARTVAAAAVGAPEQRRARRGPAGKGAKSAKQGAK